MPSPITESTLFDVASLTKAIACSLVTMTAFEAGELALELSLGELLTLPPEAQDKAPITLSQLLNHQSGMPAWRPYFKRLQDLEHATVSGRNRIREQVLAEPLEAAPGERERYSDLGYITLDAVLEARLGAPLDVLFAERIAQPLGLEHTVFVPVLRGASPLSDVVCTEDVAWRGGVICGGVHDGNTWSMGGVSGHAGLFSTARDLGVIARALLSLDAGEGCALPISRSTLSMFWDRRWRHPGGHHLLGWDTPSGTTTSAGAEVSWDETVGHLGFTGCSLWIDRRRAGYGILLTNRVHPSREETRLRALRPRFHDEAWRWIDRERG